MNKDIRIAVTMPYHPKTKMLIRRLGQGSFYNLITLLTWVAQNKPKGVLENMTHEHLEMAAEWDGDQGLFIRTLIELRFLDETDEGLQVHDWEEHNAFASFACERSERARTAAITKWKTSTGEASKTKRSERLAAARKKGKHTKNQWEEMKAFFDNTCVKCYGETQLDGVVKDHIIPIYQDSSDGIDNLQPLCAKCNAGKGPECYDYRIDYCNRFGIEMPAEWLHKEPERLRNACGTPAESKKTSAPSPSPSPSPKDNNTVVSKKTTPPKKPDLTAQEDEVIASWKMMAARFGLPGIKSMPAARLKVLKARLKDPEWAKMWSEAMNKIPNIPAVLGKNGRGWRGDIDWFLRPNTVTKILEGKYEGWGNEQS